MFITFLKLFKRNYPFDCTSTRNVGVNPNNLLLVTQLIIASEPVQAKMVAQVHGRVGGYTFDTLTLFQRFDCFVSLHPVSPQCHQIHLALEFHQRLPSP